MKLSQNPASAFIEALLQRVREFSTHDVSEVVLDVSLVTDSDGALVVHLLCLYPDRRRKVVVALGSTPGAMRVTYLQGDTVRAIVKRYTDPDWLGLLPTLWPEIQTHLSKA
jgi:hypothetical protein